MVSYRFYVIIFASLITSGIISGQSFSEKKFIAESFPANRDITLEIDNKYGSVSITPWSADSVAITAEIEGTAPSLDRLHKMIGGVTVNLSETGFLIRAETEFDQAISMLIESFKGITDKLIPYDSRLRINYNISVPRYLNLRISNKYGDVSLENCTGKFWLSLSNGSFRANSVELAEKIELAFCDAKINSIGEGDIDASFSEISIGESGNLTISSVSSRFDLGKADKVHADSKRDNFFMGSVKYLKGISYFTDFRIDELEKQINIDMKYGSIRAGMLKKSIETVTITSGNTDIDLTFDPAVSYNLEIRHRNTFIVLPEKNSRIQKKSLDDDNNEYITSGSVGRNPGNVKINIDATRGNIYIK